MKIFVINLRDRFDRRENVIRNFAELPVDYELYPAIEGEGALREHFSGRRYWVCLLEAGRSASSGEIACYASHLSLWKKCVELALPIVIMEDDFRITPGFLGALKYIEGKIDECGFVRMEPLEQRWAQKKNLAAVLAGSGDGYRLLYQRMPSVRATGYAISPKCAQALVSVSDRFVGPVDFMIRRCWVHGQPLFAIDPPPIQLAEVSRTPSIKGRKKSFVRNLIMPMRLVYRYLERRRAVRHSARQLQTPPLKNMLKKMAA